MSLSKGTTLAFPRVSGPQAHAKCTSPAHSSEKTRIGRIERNGEEQVLKSKRSGHRILSDKAKERRHSSSVTR